MIHIIRGVALSLLLAPSVYASETAKNAGIKRKAADDLPSTALVKKYKQEEDKKEQAEKDAYKDFFNTHPIMGNPDLFGIVHEYTGTAQKTIFIQASSGYKLPPVRSLHWDIEDKTIIVIFAGLRKRSTKERIGYETTSSLEIDLETGKYDDVEKTYVADSSRTYGSIDNTVKAVSHDQTLHALCSTNASEKDNHLVSQHAIKVYDYSKPDINQHVDSEYQCGTSSTPLE